MWPFAKMEHRESATDAIVTALIAQAGGSSAPPSAGDLAAVEAAAGLWSRAFASATVEPTTASTTALTPGILAAIGRGLAVRGDVLFAIDVMGGVMLTQASGWEVRGGTRPESWTYVADFPVPGGKKRKRTLPANSVIHLRYAARPAKPWEGVSPLGMASETQALAGWLEKRLAEEVSTATAYMLALPEAKSSVEGLKADLKKGGGRLHIVDTTASAWGDGKDSAPRRDWESSRLGASPLKRWGSSGGMLRTTSLEPTESHLRFMAPVARRGSLIANSWLAPSFLLAKMVLEELALKLDIPNLALDFSELRAADISSRARAYKQLVDAGMTKDEAMAKSGLD